jgi:nucleoside-diphosphate-sugar epimerase
MILVTGGTGLLGGHLLLELMKQDQPVRVLMRRKSKPEKVLDVWKHYHPKPEELLNRIEWVETDMMNRAELDSFIQAGSRVFHCAGMVSFQTKDKKEVYASNVLLTRLLLDICQDKGIEKLVHVSSVATIGTTGNGFAGDETTQGSVKARKGYSDSKMQAELEVWRAIAEGLNAVIVNPSVILGAGSWEQSSSRIFDVVYRGLNYHTTGVTGYVDAEDVARSMIGLMNSDISGERFILNAVNLSFRELFEKIAIALRKKPPSKHAGPMLTQIACRLETLLSLVTRHEAKITPQTVRSAHSVKRYSANKVCTALDFRFQEIDSTISRIAKNYLSDQ